MRNTVKILMLVTADYAAVEPLTNKLNVLGVFRNIAVESFPATHRRMYLVVKIGGVEDSGVDPHRLSVSIADEFGVESARFESSFQLLPSATGIPPEHNALFEVNGVVFNKPGEYSFRVSVNDGEADEKTIVQVLKREK